MTMPAAAADSMRAYRVAEPLPVPTSCVALLEERQRVDHPSGCRRSPRIQLKDQRHDASDVPVRRPCLRRQAGTMTSTSSSSIGIGM